MGVIKNKKRVSAETIIRTVVLAVTLINSVLTAAEKNPLPFAENELYDILSSLATLGASVWAWWKNNSFTKNAIEADEALNNMKRSL